MKDPLPASAYASIAQMVAFRHHAKNLTFFPRLMAKSPLAGKHCSRIRGRGMDFDEVRPYQAGDDMRTIDWRVTARTTLTHTKLFREERERSVLVICDLRVGMFFGSKQLKSVIACEVSAALCWAALAANERVGGMIFSPAGQLDIRSQRSHHSVLRLLHGLEEASKSLASLTATKQTHLSLNFETITKDLRRVARPGSSVFIVSDFHDATKACEANLFHVARHSDLTLIQVYDALETQLPPPGRYPVFDGNQRFTLNTNDTKFRERYANDFSQRQQQVQQLANRVQAPLLTLKTDSDVMTLLRQVYGKKVRQQ